MRDALHDAASPEAQFAQFAVTGSQEALARALAAVADPLMQTAFALCRDREQAADLVQDTLLTAIQVRGTFDRNARLLPWLAGILRNHDHRRRRNARRHPDPGRVAHVGDADPAHALQLAEARAAIDRAVALLPQPYREVVLLHLRDDMTPEAISRSLGRPTATVRTQLFRGLRKVRGRLPPGLATVAIAALATRAAQARATATDGRHAAPLRAGRRALFAGLAASLALGLVTWSWSRSVVGPVATDPSVRPLAEAAARRAAATGSAAVDAAAEVRQPVPERGGSVVVRLRWADTLLPAADQSVRLNTMVEPGTRLMPGWFAHVRSLATDAAGVARFTDVPSGIARVLFDDSSHRSEELTIVDGQETTVAQDLASLCDVHGLVLDRNDAPVPDAEVWLSSAASSGAPGYVAGRSAADGSFVVRALFSGWSVWARAEGHGVSQMQAAAAGLRQAHVRLVFHDVSRELGGTVAASDGRPIAGATVAVIARFQLSLSGARLAPFPIRYASTDRRGCFVVDSLNGGGHVVVASAPGFAPAWMPVGIGLPQTSVALSLRPPAVASGRVLGAEGGQDTRLSVMAVPRTPYNDWSVQALTACSAPVGPDGAYRVGQLPAGTVDLLVIDAGQGGRMPPAAQGVIEAEEGRTHLLDLQVGRAGCISGVVQDPAGAPRAGYVVAALPMGFDWGAARDDFVRARTDAAGRFELRGLGPALHRCFIEEAEDAAAGGGHPCCWTGNTSPGGPAIVVTVGDHQRRSGRIRGSVHAPVGDLKVEGIHVTQLPWGQTVTVAPRANGTFALDRVPPGSYCLTARLSGGPAPILHPLATCVVAPDQEVDAGRCELPAPGRLVVRVQWDDGSGTTVPATVRVLSTDGGALVVLDAARPEGVATPLPAGSYRVEAWPSDGLRCGQDVKARAGESVEALLLVSRARPCRIRLRAPDRPFPEGRTWLRLTGRAGFQHVTVLPVSPDRFYPLDVGLPAGEYELEALTFRGATGRTAFTVDAATGAPIEVSVRMR